MTTMEDLLVAVEADPTVVSPKDRAMKLLQSVPSHAYAPAIVALAQMVFVSRGRPTRDNVLGRPTASTTSTPSPAASTRKGHASPKVLAARNAWNDWLATQITMPDTGQRLALRDMTSTQITTVAHAMFDMSEQLIRLAEHMDETGANTAADLDDTAAAAILEAAA